MSPSFLQVSYCFVEGQFFETEQKLPLVFHTKEQKTPPLQRNPYHGTRSEFLQVQQATGPDCGHPFLSQLGHLSLRERPGEGPLAINGTDLY